MSDPVVIFPDAVALVIGHVRAELLARGDTAKIGSRVPNPRPNRFVLIRRLGGPRLNVAVDDALLGFECWDLEDPDAHDLAQLCRGLVNALPEALDGVARYRVGEASGPQLLPDPTSDHPRFVFTVTVALRGAKEVPVP